MVKISPIKLEGNRIIGFALDFHIISSAYIGDNEFGRPQFDTQRSKIGELVYKLKYQSDASALGSIIDTAVNFLLNEWKIDKSIDCIIPVPPSTSRKFQPVIEIAKGIGDRLNIPTYSETLKKIKDTPQLKNIGDPKKKKELLEAAFLVEGHIISGKNVLLFDDLYDSGATSKAITQVLYLRGLAKKVFLLTLTKTRSGI